MTAFEELAYASRLKTVSPACKAGFALFTMAVCLCVARVPFSVGVLLLTSALCIGVSGVPLQRWLRLLIIPFWFLLIGCVLIAVSYQPVPDGIWQMAIPGGYLAVTHVNLFRALELFFKALACVSCLYFLCVTTPLGHLLGLLERINTPALLVELMLMTYRFIFILAQLAEQMTTAQRARLGNLTYRASVRSLAALLATLFLRAMQKSGRIYDAMESRGYTGEIAYTGVLPVATMGQWLLLGGYAALLMAAGVAVRLAMG